MRMLRYMTNRFVATFIFTFFSFSILGWILVERKSELERTQFEKIFINQRAMLETHLTRLLFKTQSLAAIVMQNQGEIHHFESVAPSIMDDPSMLNLLLAPDGIVSHIYPLEGNEKALGLNFFAEGAGNKEAIQARDTGQLVLGGPFPLIQGGHALVGRLPVYLDMPGGQKKFWGLVSVTLKFPEVLAGAELNRLRELGLYYEIWRISPDTGERQVIAASTPHWEEGTNFLETSFDLMNATWHFRLAPLRNWYEFPETWVYIFFTLLTSLLAAFIVQSYDELKKMKNRLERIAMNDELTGTLNRRGLFDALRSCGQCLDKLEFCYFDLDQFKSINDTYGHDTGDKVLQAFVSALRKQMPAGSLLGRMGGDEFVLVTFDEESRKRFQEEIPSLREALRDMVQVEGQPLPILFSMGMSGPAQPEDTVDTMLLRADTEMYKEKQANWQGVGPVKKNIRTRKAQRN